jgi:hypothetical protein
VLFDEDPSREPVLIIFGVHRHCSLDHDRAVVQLEIDQVDRTARDLDPVLERLLLSVEARERRQQRRRSTIARS